MVDVSLTLNTVAAILIAVSITFEIPRELRDGVASTLLTKPLGRTQYIVGKFIGISIAGIVVTGLVAAILIPINLPTMYCVRPRGLVNSVEATPSRNSRGISKVIDTAIKMAATVFRVKDTSTIKSLCIPKERISYL
jgi:ABC-type Na+ efflux pump permease subunit